ncbi:hypothetical protein Y1Q_0021462 [Alligator mississippiensis]|uniref:Uncharacterized protein n=1 Tax=Alligator mississippiensis TaxID=8496 RepID=A0A151P9P7_ALLMI|nr:hypothetical protein Y1Q_0021462 [Alligator mississippiensis]
MVQKEFGHVEPVYSVSRVIFCYWEIQSGSGLQIQPAPLNLASESCLMCLIERSYSSISGRKNAFGGQILSLAMIQEDGLTDVNIMDTINVSKFKVGKSFICFVNMFATIANKAF